MPPSAPLARYQEPASDDGRFGNTYLRWTLLHTLIVITLCSMPVWLHFALPKQVAYVNVGGMAFFSVIWVMIAGNAILNYVRMTRNTIPANLPHCAVVGSQEECGRRFRHIVIVPCYLDPINVLFDCLGSLLSQRHPESLVVVVAFEKKTPDLQQKIETVRTAFQGRFGELLLTVHTIQWAREIPGGCSNKNFALHTVQQHVSMDPRYQETSYTVTTCDTDTLFSPHYFEVLEKAYNEENPPSSSRPVKLCVWQGPLFYNWNLDQRPFFNRITGIMRSLMMLGGLISFNLNPMSVFSYPLELGQMAGFINPRYSVDDIIFLVRVMCSAQQGIPVKLLRAPVISGPTIGTTWWEEVDEWARQIRRWIIGSSESFHYFLTHYRGRPFFAGLRWFVMFFVYYAILLCCAGLFTAAAAIPLPGAVWPHPWLRYAGVAALAIQYVVFGIAFGIDRCAVRYMTVKENVSCCRNLLHWLVAPIVLLVYSLVAFYAVVKFAFRSKKDAGHVMAAKEGFQAVTAVLDQAPSESTEAESFHSHCEQVGRQNPLDRRPVTGLRTCTRPPLSYASLSYQADHEGTLSFEVQQRAMSFPLHGGPNLGSDGVNRSEGEGNEGKELQATDMNVSEDGKVLCHLPDSFYFGTMSFPTARESQETGTSPPRTHLYGL
ncbi:ANKRD50 [Symbiodinium necroappetens]|uniref:ANKRD50 protein n=1 Tax=Symbiodinium necroappetens TaxID=1628268 RepID=A0A812IST0_9DINO|nr:ANKRD50 [Symbiodinium necroappetens]